MAKDRSITISAQAWLIESLGPQKLRPGNPFYYEDDKLRIKYDSIRIKNLSQYDGRGVQVGYCYQGVKMVIFNIMDVGISNPTGSPSIELSGMSGSMEMVVIDEKT